MEGEDAGKLKKHTHIRSNMNDTNNNERYEMEKSKFKKNDAKKNHLKTGVKTMLQKGIEEEMHVHTPNSFFRHLKLMSLFDFFGGLFARKKM
jgi:hypothetical protein